ncbi:MAG: FAD:protein FMN transferase [Candidatus Izemoplasmataceae bacterium]
MKKYIGLLSLLFIFLLSACQEETLVKSQKTILVFDTIVTVDLYGTPDTDFDTIKREVETILDEVHTLSTKYDAYEGVNNVKTLNDNPGEAIIVDPMIIDMIKLSIESYNDPLTQGKFNIAIGEVLKIWSSYRDDCLSLSNPVCEIPDQSELLNAAINTDPNNIIIDEEASTVTIPEGMSIDLGGFAKGYGSKLVSDYLRTQDLSAYQVNAGASNVEFYGPHPSATRDHWIGSLRNPMDTSTYYALVRVNSGQNIVTSGDYERFFVVDDVSYHHIIDPDDFYPPNHTRTATVISEDPALGDLYSTIIFLLEVDDALTFINSLDEVEAVIVTEDGKAHFSENFIENHLHSLRIETDYDLSEMQEIEPLTPEDEGINSITLTLIITFGLIVAGFIAVSIKEKRKQQKENQDV